MKSIFLLFIGLLAAPSAFAQACHLEHAIPLTRDLLSQGIVLKSVVVDASPAFADPNNYDPSKDKLELRIFNIEWNSQPMNHLGVRLEVAGKHESTGFADKYFGNYLIAGRASKTDNGFDYETRMSLLHTEPQHAKNPALTETVVKIENDKITAIWLKSPVYKVWKEVDGVTYSAFTGVMQNICIKSAQ